MTTRLAGDGGGTEGGVQERPDREDSHPARTSGLLRPRLSMRLKRTEQDEETAQPKLFYSKVRTPRRETYGGAAVNADR